MFNDRASDTQNFYPYEECSTAAANSKGGGDACNLCLTASKDFYPRGATSQFFHQEVNDRVLSGTESHMRTGKKCHQHCRGMQGMFTLWLARISHSLSAIRIAVVCKLFWPYMFWPYIYIYIYMYVCIYVCIYVLHVCTHVYYMYHSHLGCNLLSKCKC